MVGTLAIILTGLDCMAPRTSRKIRCAAGGDSRFRILDDHLSFVFSRQLNYGLDEVVKPSVLLLIFVWAMHPGRGQRRQSCVTDTRCANNRRCRSDRVLPLAFAVYCLNLSSRFVGTFSTIVFPYGL